MKRHTQLSFDKMRQSPEYCENAASGRMEFNMPKVSVISGAYNIGSCYSFEKSINSILDQTYSDFEFIICDDGSSDNTWELLTEFAKEDARIKLLRNEKNLGLAATLNRCIDASAGEYVARHDCDDYAARERLERQIDCLEKRPELSLVGTFAYLFDEKGVWGEMRFPEEIGAKDFLFCSPYQHGSVVFRRSALLRAGKYRVAKDTRRTEDYDLFMTLQTFAKGANLPEFLYYFCEDKNTLSRRKYRYRIDEARVRFKGFKKLGLLPKGLPYVIKPLAVGLIPPCLLSRLKNKYRRKKIAPNDVKI